MTSNGRERIERAAGALREQAEVATGGVLISPSTVLLLAKWLESLAPSWAWDDPEGDGIPTWDDGTPLRLDESTDSHLLTLADAASRHLAVDGSAYERMTINHDYTVKLLRIGHDAQVERAREAEAERDDALKALRIVTEALDRVVDERDRLKATVARTERGE